MPIATGRDHFSELEERRHDPFHGVRYFANLHRRLG
jgi:hypothetical protein